MNTQTKWETGATSAAVNELILYTDMTRELAALRDEIYMLWVEKKYVMSGYAFAELLKEAIQSYVKEFGINNSVHIKYMGNKQREEYRTIYANDFDNWKKEHNL